VPSYSDIKIGVREVVEAKVVMGSGKEVSRLDATESVTLEETKLSKEKKHKTSKKHRVKGHPMTVNSVALLKESIGERKTRTVRENSDKKKENRIKFDKTKLKDAVHRLKRPLNESTEPQTKKLKPSDSLSLSSKTLDQHKVESLSSSLPAQRNSITRERSVSGDSCDSRGSSGKQSKRSERPSYSSHTECTDLLIPHNVQEPLAFEKDIGNSLHVEKDNSAVQTNLQKNIFASRYHGVVASRSM